MDSEWWVEKKGMKKDRGKADKYGGGHLELQQKNSGSE